MERTGSKVCKLTAEQIRSAVTEEINKNGHVDPNLVKDILRPLAQDDARFHENWNISFSGGNGPAVIRH